jgi:hypothetical protein
LCIFSIFFQISPIGDEKPELAVGFFFVKKPPYKKRQQQRQQGTYSAYLARLAFYESRH